MPLLCFNTPSLALSQMIILVPTLYSWLWWRAKVGTCMNKANIHSTVHTEWTSIFYFVGTFAGNKILVPITVLCCLCLQIFLLCEPALTLPQVFFYWFICLVDKTKHIFCVHFLDFASCPINSNPPLMYNHCVQQCVTIHASFSDWLEGYIGN